MLVCSLYLLRLSSRRLKSHRTRDLDTSGTALSRTRGGVEVRSRHGFDVLDAACWRIYPRRPRRLRLTRRTVEIVKKTAEFEVAKFVPCPQAIDHERQGCAGDQPHKQPVSGLVETSNACSCLQNRVQARLSPRRRKYAADHARALVTRSHEMRNGEFLEAGTRSAKLAGPTTAVHVIVESCLPCELRRPSLQCRQSA